MARFDDRGVGSTGGVYFDASWEDLSIDTQSIVEQLKQHPKVDQNRIGLVGMSQGGAVAAMTSIREPEVDFVVLLSAPGLSGVDTLTQQFESCSVYPTWLNRKWHSISSSLSNTWYL